MSIQKEVLVHIFLTWRLGVHKHITLVSSSVMHPPPRRLHPDDQNWIHHLLDNLFPHFVNYCGIMLWMINLYPRSKNPNKPNPKQNKQFWSRLSCWSNSYCNRQRLCRQGGGKRGWRAEEEWTASRGNQYSTRILIDTSHPEVKTTNFGLILLLPPLSIITSTSVWATLFSCQVHLRKHLA